MDSQEKSDDSLLYIDDSSTDEELNNDQYKLKIIENFQDKNRNIEISNQSLNEIDNKSLSPVAPLAEDTETSDNSRFSEEPERCEHVKKLNNRQTRVKLVLKSRNSVVSIKGLDNKSSITVKRKNERKNLENMMKLGQRNDKHNHEKIVKSAENTKPNEKSKKGRWKTLTRSLISKSGRFERRGLDERYPKYVLLKNEEEITKDTETYPKMVVFNEKKTRKKKEKENSQTKSDFNFKKSFKNKTNPILPMNEILGKTEDEKEENEEMEKNNKIIEKKIVVDRRKSLACGKTEGESREREKGAGSKGQVFHEIQGIIEDTLKLYSNIQPSGCGPCSTKEQSDECFSSNFYQISCSDQCCFSANQPPVYIPVYSPYKKPMHFYKNSNTQTNGVHEQIINGDLSHGDEDKEAKFHELSFGLLPNLIPRVIVMKPFQNEYQEEMKSMEREQDVAGQMGSSDNRNEWKGEKESRNTLDVPPQNLTIKSKMVLEGNEEPKSDFHSEEFFVNTLTINDFATTAKSLKIETDDSETTEYLDYCDEKFSNHESTNPEIRYKPLEETKDGGKLVERKKMDVDDDDDDGDSGKNLSLTKIGFKMYDNLTKLSLNCEKEEKVEKAEVGGCGCSQGGSNNSPANITLECNNGTVKVTMPETELNFQIVNPEGKPIQIGIEKDSGKKKIVKKSELWHLDEDKRDFLVATSEHFQRKHKGCQKIKLSLADDKKVVLSIETDEKKKQEEEIKEKTTKEIKVGTDDFDLAGGDFSFPLGKNYQNLSPRTGQLLKNLQEKLMFEERERKFLAEKITEKLTDEKFREGIFPGIFLVKQISPRETIAKKPLQLPSVKTQKKNSQVGNKSIGKLREYYCEECLATMRIFEDENPSVKSMVDKFETIIQLESF